MACMDSLLQPLMPPGMCPWVIWQSLTAGQHCQHRQLGLQLARAAACARAAMFSWLSALQQQQMLHDKITRLLSTSCSLVPSVKKMPHTCHQGSG